MSMSSLHAKKLGVAKLLGFVNKMDEPTVQWSKRFYSLFCCIHTHPFYVYM